MLLALVLAIAVACGSESISEKGSRADRVYVMANEGDATAQTALGLLYERGLGVAPDPAAALLWYRRAAEQGDALAAFHIGSLYERGAGVERDYVAAAEWYQRASDQGNASAQAALAYLYDRGLGVARDFSEAEALYSQASASWIEVDHYPAEATFATGREVPALAGPSVEALPSYGGRPEFTAGKEEEPAIEIDLAALDEVPDPPPAAAIFDGPEPIAGKGENFPLAGSSLQAPAPSATAVPQAPSAPNASEPAETLRLPIADEAGDPPPLPPGLKPSQPEDPLPAAAAEEKAGDGELLIAAQPEPEPAVLSVKELLADEGIAVDAKVSDAEVVTSEPEAEPKPAPEAKPEPAPEAEPEPAPEPSVVEEKSEPPAPAEAEESSGVEAARVRLAKAEENLIASLNAELDQEAQSFSTASETPEPDSTAPPGETPDGDAPDTAESDSAQPARDDEPPPLPPEPSLFMISLATYETEALALEAWDIMRTTHAGLLARLPYELQPVDMGDEGQFVELIVGPLDSPTRSRALCAALRAHSHVCRTIDR